MQNLISKSVRKRLEKQGQPIPVTFEEQSVVFLTQAKSKRNPLRPKTIETYEARLKNDILPFIGLRPLQLIDNVEVKSLVGKWESKGVSPKTMRLNISIIKQIRASATTERGEPQFPIIWNMKFLDMPKLASKKATVDAQTVQDAISKTTGGETALIALLAGSGLRIQEALALKIGHDNPDPKQSYWFPEESKLSVCSQFDGKVFGETKTAAGCREVDLHPDLNAYLKYILILSERGARMFPQSEITYYRGFVKAGIVGGFHTLRRFRSMHLDKMSCPRGLSRYWIGHAASDVHEGYEQFGKEIETRKLEVKRIGLGFELPKS